MDPFSITVGALGIAQITVSSIMAIHERLEEASVLPGETSAQLEGITNILEGLKTLKIDDAATSEAAKQSLMRCGLTDAVNKCGAACSEFDKKMQSWTRHSSKTKVNLRDKLSVGWHKQIIVTFQKRVNTTYNIVHLAVSSTTLTLQLQSIGAPKSSGPGDMLALEKSVAEQLQAAQDDAKEAEQRLRQLQNVPTDSEMDIVQQDDCVREIGEQQSLLEDAQVFFGTMFTQVRAQRTSQTVGQAIADMESNVSISLPKILAGQVEQRVDKASATNKSNVYIGGDGGVINFWSLPGMKK